MKTSEWRMSLAALLVTTACGSHVAAPATAPSPALGTTFHVDLPSSQGAVVSVGQAQGKVTVIHAFAPSCPPCAKTIGPLVAKRPELAERGALLVVVAIPVDGDTDASSAAALQRWGAPTEFLIDRDDALRVALAIDAIPATVIVDAHGVVRWVGGPDASAEQVLAAVDEVADL